MGSRIVSQDRDAKRERRLPPAARERIQAFDDARRALAVAEGHGFLARIRWQNMYDALESSDPAEVSETMAFLEERTDSLIEELPAARERGEERESERVWESQALYLDPYLSTRELERKYAGQLVWLWHGTSTDLWPQIELDGLLIAPPGRSFDNSSPGLVFLTTDYGHARDFYAQRAVESFGGDPLVLRVAVPWDDLSWDPDDADLSCGRKQFVLPRDVHPSEIREAGDQRLANLKASLMSR